MSARKVTAKIFLAAGAACLLIAAGLWGQARVAHGQLELAPAAALAPTPDRSSLDSPQLPNPEPVSHSPQPVEPTQPVVEPTQPVELTQPVEPTQPVKTTQPVETIQSAANPQPLDAAPEQGQPLYRLLIPRIKVNNTVVFGSSDGALKKAPGHIEGTPFPWHGGNSAVAAHRDYFFWRLGELEIGDEVRVESERGNRVYKVTETRVVHESDVGVLSPTGKDQITLITCWPLIFLGDTPDRLVVTAVLYQRSVSP